MADSSTSGGQSSGGHILRGSFWMISLRWGIRLTGLVSTLVLARLLTPADFGIVAMAMIVVGLLEILNETGQILAIIRHPNPTREEYDSAWTISVLVGLVIGALILVAAPLTVFYFHEPRAVPVMQCLALRAVIDGFANIGVADFRRDLRFDRFFLFNIYPKLISFVVTLTLAVLFRNYWALVFGMISGVLAGTVVSYLMHPYRPWFSFAKFEELWSFSAWSLVKNMGNYLTSQIDQVVVGGFAGAASMGRYAVAADVASSPISEVNDPLVAVLFPVMSKVQGDQERMRSLYLRVLSWSAIICASTSVGVTLIAPEFIELVLGSQWTDVIPLVGWLALSTGLLGLSSGAYATFDVLGVPQRSARLQWLRLTLLALTMFPIGFIWRDLTMLAETRFAVTLVFMPILFWTMGRTLGISVSDYVAVLWRPLAAAAVMALVVSFANREIDYTGAQRLLFDIALGAASYSSSILLLWSLSGRPESPEQDLLGFFRSKVISRFQA